MLRCPSGGVSRISSVIIMLAYIAYILFQLVTHKEAMNDDGDRQLLQCSHKRCCLSCWYPSHMSALDTMVATRRTMIGLIVAADTIFTGQFINNM